VLRFLLVLYFYSVCHFFPFSLSPSFLDRLLYFILSPIGILDSSPEVEGVFTELPVLIFFTIYTIVLLRWIELYRYTIKIRSAVLTKLAPFAIIINALLFLFFLITLIVFVTLPDYGEETNTCLGKDDATETTEIVQLSSPFPCLSFFII